MEPRAPKYLAFQLNSAPPLSRVFELVSLYGPGCPGTFYMDQLVLNSDRSLYPCFLRSAIKTTCYHI